MKSVASTHFPRVIVEPDQKWLFNPLLKKRFKNRPEERVRLQWVEFLMHQTEWKTSRIGFETPVPLRQAANALRADLILYDDAMKPFILVECKAESVALNPAVAEQAARYNTKIGAPYIVLTNGVSDFCYHVEHGQAKEVRLPIKIRGMQTKKNFLYWRQRGFCSEKSESIKGSFFPGFLERFMHAELPGETRFLAFKQSWLPFPMEHYYRMFSVDDTTKLIVSFMGESNSGTYLTAILNQNRENKGILTLNLDKLFLKDSESARLITAEKEEKMDATKILPGDFLQFRKGIETKLPELLLYFFY